MLKEYAEEIKDLKKELKEQEQHSSGMPVTVEFNERYIHAVDMLSMELFDPSGKGRAMKEWVQVPKGVLDWQELANEALSLLRERMAVLSISTKP